MPFDNPQHVPLDDIDYLRAAKDYISSRDRWLQKKYHDRGDRRCAVGAIDVVTRDMYGRQNKIHIRRLCRILARDLPLEARILFCFVPAKAKIVMFNDGMNRKHEHIIGLFDRAILRLEQNAMVCV